MNNFYPATSILNQAGGLPLIDGNDLNDGDGAIVLNENNAYLYSLDSTSGETEDLPSIISPLNNAGDKRWKLIKIFNLIDGALNQLIYSNFPGGF